MTSNEELFNCVFCKESFDNKEKLQVHFRKHGDPKFNQSVKNRVSNESDAGGDKSADVDSVSCDVCSETFPSISKAITHKHKVHPDHDAKYFCPWCGKLFTMKHLYTKHVETTHSSKMQYEGNGFHCDYCEADFFAPSAMVYHNKFFHRQDTELAAIGQSKKLKLFDQEMLLLYYCPFCGEEYFNKVNLHKHMGDDHIDENQSPDDVLRCPLCEAIFYHLDAYELHLTFHSTEDTYSEENEIVKNITEFSLEAVPPIMEKVENETISDSETTKNPMGIGEFLQLGMDESVDNGTGEKRKKKKKHKKSKKSAITFDEFLNMNKDVFGEGIDVEGIEEVPTRVVAKRLKTRPQRPKTSINIMSSNEIEKLKKQGIVVKKKSGNQGKPLNIAQNCIANKETTDKTNSISTGDVLSKLFSQSNSQLKIVKKPSLQASYTDLKEQSLDDQTLNKEASSQNNINESDIFKSEGHENENSGNDKDNEVKIISKNTIKTYLNSDSSKTLKENDEFLKKNQHKEGKNKLEITGHVAEVHKQSQEEASCTSETKNKGIHETPKNITSEYNLDMCHKNDNVNQRKDNSVHTKTKPLDALKNLSHLTVKSLNHPNVSTSINMKTETHGCEFKNEMGQLRTDNSINRKEPSQKTKDDKNLEALKLLSKNVTIKSSNKPVQVDEKNKDENEIDKLNRNKSINKEAQFNKPNDDNNLETLKLLGQNITLKSEPMPADDYLHNDKDQDADEIERLKSDESINKSQLNKPRDDKNFEALQLLSKNITIKSSNQVMKSNSDLDLDRALNYRFNNSTNKQELLHKPKDDKNLEALKLLSKSITIKLPNQSVQENKYLNSDKEQESNEDKVHNKTINKNLRNSVIDKFQCNLKSPVKCAQVAENLVFKNPIDSPKINKALLVQESKELSDLDMKHHPVISQQCNILKQLSNITAKSISKTHQQLTQIKKSIKMEEDKGIETFNIDDSDDEDEMTYSSSNLNNTGMKTSKIPMKNSNPHHSENFKNVGHPVTIKTTNQQNRIKSFSHCENSDGDDCDPLSYDTHNDEVSEGKQCKTRYFIGHENFVLQSKLNNLSKHITVKSRNSSPKQIKTNQSMHQDSDTEIVPSKVKITELPDNFSADDEYDECQDVQSPSCIVEFSENEDYDKNDEEDIETQLKCNTLQKATQRVKQYSNNSPLNNFQNINKDITIKSLGNKNNIHSEDEDELPQKCNSNKIANAAKELYLKHQNNVPSKQIDRSGNEMAKSSNVEQNTANTEVIVKKFGTKTVIEEITTTVTKTIRTVNQTVQKEVINSCQTISPNTRSQNMAPRQVCEGKQIRQATPTIGTRVRSVTPQVRPSIKPTQKIVSIRPGLNIRPSNPMTAVNKPTCTTTSNAKQPVIGKPLKISPNVFSTSNKRPTSEDADRPFSCFKKQKESLIPIGDLPKISQGDTSVLYASSHVNKSHVSNTTKIMAANSMITSSQVKSESCTSSEQFSRLATVSGLKIVKTSSSQQTSKMEECMIKPNQKNALEAIERLKKQGLLIKKPRLDDNYSEHSNSDDNFN